jgi:hypothetical protein
MPKRGRPFGKTRVATGQALSFVKAARLLLKERAFHFFPHLGEPMKKINLVVAGVLAVSASHLFAQTAAPAAEPAAAAAPAPTPDWTITGNMALSSDYRTRGISQTNKMPALSGGFDIAHSSGFYVGNWNSNVDSDYYTGANLEIQRLRSAAEQHDHDMLYVRRLLEREQTRRRR